MKTTAKIRTRQIEPENDWEVVALIESGKNRFNDAGLPQLSIESLFDLAYNASHALALAALRHSGYRSSNRYLVFQCLGHTLGMPPEQWRVLSTAYVKRNNAEYEGLFDVDEALVSAMIRVADELYKTLIETTGLA